MENLQCAAGGSAIVTVGYGTEDDGSNGNCQCQKDTTRFFRSMVLVRWMDGRLLEHFGGIQFGSVVVLIVVFIFGEQ